MLERQNVIKGLTECVAAGLEKACPANCPYFLKCFPDVGLATPFVPLMADALAMLKEQEAVEPILKREGRNKYYNYYVCPRCNEEVVYDQNYCSECGAKFMWEGR